VQFKWPYGTVAVSAILQPSLELAVEAAASAAAPMPHLMLFLVPCCSPLLLLSVATYFQGRTDVQCLHRWQKVLNPELIKGCWTKEVSKHMLCHHQRNQTSSGLGQHSC
jgi:hypothetical protein